MYSTYINDIINAIETNLDMYIKVIQTEQTRTCNTLI